MTMRKRIILTCCWILVSFVLGAAVAVFLGTRPSGRMSASARGSAAGMASGLLASIGCGALWIPWAAEQGRRRREQQQQRAKQKAPGKKRRGSREY